MSCMFVHSFSKVISKSIDVLRLSFNFFIIIYINKKKNSKKLYNDLKTFVIENKVNFELYICITKQEKINSISNVYYKHKKFK